MSISDEKRKRGWTPFIGARRLEEFELALLDPELISLRHELARIDARLTDLDERRQLGEPYDRWLEFKTHLKKLQPMLDDPILKDDFKASIRAMCDIAEEGISDQQHWDKSVAPLIRLRRQVAETERMYEDSRKYFVPIGALAQMFDALHAAIEFVVPERATQLALLYEVRHRLEGYRTKPNKEVLQLPTEFSVERRDVPDATVIEAETEPENE